MRLLITTDTVGGVWTYTKELSEGMLQRGHDILLISMGRLPSPDQYSWVRRVECRWASRFTYIPTKHALEWMQDNTDCYHGAELLLMTQIATWSPDILHLSQFCYGALPTGLPKIVIAHSDVRSWSQACRGALPEDCAWSRRYLQLVSLGLLQADAVVAPTRWMLSALCSNYKVPACHAVISNGISLPSTQATASRKQQAVTIGRLWDEGKNVRLLGNVDSPMPMLVGGELAVDDTRLFTSPRLQLLGQLSGQATLKLFAESSIYIATSRYEPFGLAPLEAALSGCALLAHDIASMREVWGQSALYFESAGALSELLHALHVNRALLRSAAKQARARALGFYSRDTMISNYLALYAQLGAPESSEEESVGTAQHVF